MLNISDASKDIYLDGSILKTLTINFPNANVTLTNSDLIKESLELTEAIENENEITFQGCIASQLKFQCADIIQDLRGEYVTVTLGAQGADSIPLFKGYVDSQTNRTYEDVVTEFTCYDAIYRKGQLDVTDWYNGLTFPMTVKAFRNSFFSRIGITQQSRTLVNDSQKINKVTTENQILALDVMRAICQVNGAYGQIGRDGKFKYVELLEIVRGLYPEETLYPSPDLYPARENAGAEFDRDGYIEASYEPFEVKAIDKVNVVGFNGRFIGTYGNGTNAFTIADNIVAQGSATPDNLAKNLVEKLYMVKYIPSNVEVPGLPWVECGDIYLFNTYKNIIRAYTFNRVLKGIQSLIDKFSADGVQDRNPYIESALTQTTTNETGIQSNTSSIQQNAEAIVDEHNFTVDGLQEERLYANEIVANAIRTTELYADQVSASAIRTSELYADRITANAIQTAELYADNITANAIRTTELYADQIGSEAERVSKLYADNITASAIRTTEAYADSVSTTKMNAAEAYARQLNADKATISQLESTNATISRLNTEIVHTNEAVATKASITELNAATARIGTLEATSITANTFTTGVNGVRITSGNVYANSYSIGSTTYGSAWFSNRAQKGTYNVYSGSTVIGTVTIL